MSDSKQKLTCYRFSSMRFTAEVSGSFGRKETETKYCDNLLCEVTLSQDGESNLYIAEVLPLKEP